MGGANPIVIDSAMRASPPRHPRTNETVSSVVWFMAGAPGCSWRGAVGSRAEGRQDARVNDVDTTVLVEVASIVGAAGRCVQRAQHDRQIIQIDITIAIEIARDVRAAD